MGREQQLIERIAAELNAELLNLEKVYVEKIKLPIIFHDAHITSMDHE